MICEKCNKQNNEDAKYCCHCGIKLNENKEETDELIENFKGVIKGMVKKPISTLKEYIKKNISQESLILLAINVVTFSLFLVVFVYATLGIGYNNIGNLYYQTFGMDLPYFKIFLLSIIYYLAIYSIFAASIYLIVKYLLKKEIDFKKIICWLGINSLLLTFGYLVVMLLMFISVKLTVIFSLIILLLYIYNMFRSLNFAININEDYVGYLITLSIALTFVVVKYLLPIILI